MRKVSINKTKNCGKLQVARKIDRIAIFVAVFAKFCKIANSGSGHHRRSSPLGDMQIPRRTTARAHFVVINIGAGQFCLSSDTR